MKLYKLTEEEARALAWEISHRNWAPDSSQSSDFKQSIQTFMDRYNVVMNAVDFYNKQVGDD